MHKGFLRAAVIMGALSVLAGAFAAHGLRKILSADALQIFETAVRYQFYHVFALLAAGILYKEYPGRAMKWAGNLFITGIILFSGSLYLLCYIMYNQFPLNWVGAITPFGGTAFIAGWIMLLVALNRRHQN